MGLLDATLSDGRRWTKVGDCFEITRKPRGLRVSEDEAVPFVPMDAIPQGGHYDPRYDTKLGAHITSGTYFERGDLLIAKITPSFENGKQAWAKGLPAPFGYATTEVIPLRPKSPCNDRRLLFFYLLHPEIRSFISERMEGSTGRQRVPEQVLLELSYPELPLEDQRAIADTLECITQHIEFEDHSAQTAQELKRAVMRELFTRGLRGEPQKDTEIGPVPASWEVVSIDKVATQTQYGLSVRGQTSGRTPILRMNCQEDGRVVFRDLQYVDLDDETLATFRLEPGDLLFNRTNSIEHVGRTAIYEDSREAVFASYLIRLSVNKELCLPSFLNYFMNHPEVQADIKKLASRAVGQANINATKLRTVSFPMPPSIDEQREIVAILDAIDRKIALHREKRRVLQELFKALLHKLMTGEIRVAELDLSALEPHPMPRVAA